MGNKVDLIEEIRARLANGITAGEPLEDVKRIRIGSKEELRDIKNFPIININIISGEEIPIGMPRQFTDQMTFEISLIINKKNSDSNTIYDTSDSSGGLYLLEALLNVLDKDSAGTNVNLTFDDNANELRTISWTLDQSKDNLLIFSVTITVNTVSFTVGSR